VSDGCGSARGKKYCDQRRENGEGEAAKLSVCQGGSAKLLTVIHNPRQALFKTADFTDGTDKGWRVHLGATPSGLRPFAVRTILWGFAGVAPPSIRFCFPIWVIRVICGLIMLAEFEKQLSQTLEEIKSQGLYKTERIITTPQDAHIAVADGKRVLNMCANNYLGLADHPALIAAAKEALDTHGFGMASVRFICGTQDIHKKLEAALTKFLGTEETILYPSCFDANGGLFETLLTDKDAVISDELNHASIIDGIRLCKAQRFRYKNNDMGDLETKLREATGARFRLIATDGCFSMDGTIANLNGIVELAEKYNALTMIDDAHAAGFLGKTGRGTHEHCGVMGKIDIITGTLGKALGGASGGYTSGRKEIVDLLRQRSRPYLFSNTIAPPVVAASLKAIEMLSASTELRDKLEENTKHFRAALTERGLTIKPGMHPIVPIMIGDAAKSQKFAARMLEKGVYVIGFFYPVVPHGTARVRTQVSAAHSREDLDFAVNAFAETNDELK
jgi:glycine C-acetyltransferase